MQRFLSILLCLIFLTISLGAASPCETPRGVRIEGKKARKQARYELYEKVYRGDKLEVFERHGYTPNRLRVDHGFGEITETWTYYDRGLEFTFDQDSELVERRSIPVEDRSVPYY